MNKTQLAAALNDAHDALAYGLSTANDALRGTRRAIRAHPQSQWLIERREEQITVHERLKHHIKTWLTPEQVAAVRAKAAKFVRRDLWYLRKRRSDQNAMPVAA
jgi:hypothetical protein